MNVCEQNIFSSLHYHMELVVVEDYPEVLGIATQPMSDFYHIRIPIDKGDERTIGQVYLDYLAQHPDARPIERRTFFFVRHVTGPVARAKARQQALRKHEPFPYEAFPES